MSEPILLLSAATITPSEFVAFLTEIGAVLDPDEVFDGRLSTGNRHIWLRLDDREIGQLEPPTVQRVADALGDRPRSSVVVEISRTPGSERLAADFADQFSRRWPSVVFDFRDSIAAAGQS
jgi:hypothetical protein